MEYSDIINNLKTDKEQPTSEEIIILDNVFVENKKNFSALFSEFKEVILILVLFPFGIFYNTPSVNKSEVKFPFYYDVPSLLIVLILLFAFWNLYGIEG